MDADSPPLRRWWLRIGATFLALFVLYVLSSGPVLGAFNYQYVRTVLDGEGIETTPTQDLINDFYQPLEPLSLALGLDRAYQHYLTWWAILYFRRAGMTP
jgi:hypothetical protein